MRLGLALMKVRNPRDGTAYRQVPRQPRRARSNDLTRFTGVVLFNNPETRVITIMSTHLDSTYIAMHMTQEPPLRVDVHYSAFKKMMLLSKAHFEPFDTYTGRPTKRQGLGEQRKAFRTRENVDLD